MLVQLFDEDGFEATVGMDNVDGSVGLAKPDSPVALPCSLEGVITKSGDCTSGNQTVHANEVGPDGEFSNDLRWGLCQLLAGSLGKLDLH
jgi:hypothetical protein